MDNTRLISDDADDAERAVESALRPRKLDEFIGQKAVCEQLSLLLQAAKMRRVAPDHVLLAISPGLGKNHFIYDHCQEMGPSRHLHRLLLMPRFSFNIVILTGKRCSLLMRFIVWHVLLKKCFI